MDDETGHVNRFEGSASAHAVVQAGEVHGGVHFHQQPVPAPAVVPHQLRGAVRHFVNRSQEQVRLGGLVASGHDEPHVVRVAVITGTAGVGKTSLALHWAHSIRPHFPGGELYANLRGYSAGSPASPQEILGNFLEDLGVPSTRVPAERERRETMFRSLLADRRMLIVLDNAAHSTQVRPLLPATAACLVVVTSRDDLSGLVVQQGALRLELMTFPTTDAVALLRATTADYRTRDRRSELTELARLCAGLPLALRIAAERAAGRPALPLGELIDELRDESARWSILTADADEGADAMRSVFEWSYQALSGPAARLFRLLGLHPGNEFGLPAVANLAGTEPPQTRALLDTLVRAHLLERRPAGRYEFHDLLRAYAAEQVRQEESEADRTEILGRCLAWYLHTAYAAQCAIAPFDRYDLDDRTPTPATQLHFEGYDTAFQWYRTESANLVTAVRVAGAEFPGIAWRLAVVLRAVYMHHNAFEDWVTTARIAVDAAARAGEQAGQAETLENLGKAAFQALRLDEAEECHRAALAMRRGIGDKRGTAVSINALGLLGLRRRRLDEATCHFEDSAEIFRELGDHRWTALMRSNLAETLCELGRGAEAGEIVEQALADFCEIGDHFGEGNALFLLSWARRESGDLEAAGRAIDAALLIADDEDNHVWRGHWLAESAKVERARGNPEKALRLFRESAAVQRRLGDAAREAAALDGAGEACQVLGRFEEAAKLNRRAVATYRGLDARWQLANALEHLSGALGPLGERETARAVRQEVLILLGPFDDPQAVALAERVARNLGDDTA
ncbi:ATP-binding protein [Streptomyces pinistramenti]|uniref:ATP-binding protein n=1 Tax=Streptomyces pinistramenti TaxID=2884812 RepID=UPI001D06C767|nr:tetratricopeptide repeat protein [Streptomyces pinistramenti]MCB5908179.1 tetratricopeptide repeat protein [Streptomyces pinistramenti]